MTLPASDSNLNGPQHSGLKGWSLYVQNVEVRLVIQTRGREHIALLLNTLQSAGLVLPDG